MTNYTSFKRISIPIRNQHVDIARGIAIIFVIVGHVSSAFIKEVAYCFNIPLFFIIAGMLINTRKKTLSFIKDKAIRLLLPITFWTLFSHLILSAPNIDFQHMFKELYSIIYGAHLMPEELYDIFAPLPWFLPCLFASNIIFYFLLKIKEKKKVKNNLFALMVFFLAFVGFALSNFGIYCINWCPKLPYALDLALFAQIYMWVGYNINKMIMQITK